MTTQLDEQRTPEDRSENAVDESVKDTFPASDPPAVGGATRIESASSGGPDVPSDDDKKTEGTPGQVSPQTEKPGADKPNGTEEVAGMRTTRPDLKRHPTNRRQISIADRLDDPATVLSEDSGHLSAAAMTSGHPTLGL
ncbi:hypothetical protein [Paraburkholderia tropica]|uniref:hypothetical protein n=1 Tax=Paraburkholderia tropica TaxID=92647 RepID=UPI001F2165D3|nr:hypothetical protein [Paraburkholderia tropica]